MPTSFGTISVVLWRSLRNTDLKLQSYHTRGEPVPVGAVHRYLHQSICRNVMGRKHVGDIVRDAATTECISCYVVFRLNVLKSEVESEIARHVVYESDKKGDLRVI